HGRPAGRPSKNLCRSGQGFRVPEEIAREAARLAGFTSERTARKAVRVFESDHQDIKDELDAGSISVSSADDRVRERDGEGAGEAGEEPREPVPEPARQPARDEPGDTAPTAATRASHDSAQLGGVERPPASGASGGEQQEDNEARAASGKPIHSESGGDMAEQSPGRQPRRTPVSVQQLPAQVPDDAEAGAEPDSVSVDGQVNDNERIRAARRLVEEAAGLVQTVANGQRGAGVDETFGEPCRDWAELLRET
ncbi:unnamed protein product, partial [marine sediment metagenome]